MPHDQPALTTPRLTAEPLTAAHEPELRRLLQDPAVANTLGGVRTDEDVRAVLERDLDHWQRHGFGVWMFREGGTSGSSGDFVGRAGLRWLSIGGREEVELLYALLPAFWGRGLATEMGRACLRVGFEQVGLADLVAVTLPTHHASRRVMEKLGFRYEKDVVHAGLEHVLYRLPAA